MQISQAALGERRIRGINKIGLYTLVRKEVERFLKVYTQTLIALTVTTLLFYTVFALAFGGWSARWKTACPTCHSSLRG